MKVIILAILAWIALSLLAGIALMFAVDIANNTWLPNLKGLGWWDALLIAMLIRMALLLPSRSSAE